MGRVGVLQYFCSLLYLSAEVFRLLLYLPPIPLRTATRVNGRTPFLPGTAIIRCTSPNFRPTSDLIIPVICRRRLPNQPRLALSCPPLDSFALNPWLYIRLLLTRI